MLLPATRSPQEALKYDHDKGHEANGDEELGGCEHGQAEPVNCVRVMSVNGKGSPE